MLSVWTSLGLFLVGFSSACSTPVLSGYPRFAQGHFHLAKWRVLQTHFAPAKRQLQSVKDRIFQLCTQDSSAASFTAVNYSSSHRFPVDLL